MAIISSADGKLNLNRITETDVEDLALDWLENIGWRTAHGPDIAPDTPGAERPDYTQVVLEQRLCDAIARLNVNLPSSALDDAFRKLLRPEGASLEAHNRSFHRMLVDGVTVEYRDENGAIRGTQAQVIDFEEPELNDWLEILSILVYGRLVMRPLCCFH